MNHLIKISLLALLWLPIGAYADDDPVLVEKTEEFNMDTCIQTTKNECVNSNCLTSTDMECIPKCESQAQDKCKEQALE